MNLQKIYLNLKVLTRKPRIHNQETLNKFDTKIVFGEMCMIGFIEGHSLKSKVGKEKIELPIYLNIAAIIFASNLDQNVNLCYHRVVKYIVWCSVDMMMDGGHKLYLRSRLP